MSLLPNILGIGVQRGGTSWLHWALAEHPDVWMTAPKEVNFFNRHWERGIAWYEKRFEGSEGYEHRGEVSADYIWADGAVERMAATVPNARLLVNLRDPVDRAYSAYWLHRESQNDDRSFEEMLDAKPDILGRGYYAEQLERLFRSFPREQVLIKFYDELKRDSGTYIRDVYEFLGLDPSYVPSWVGKTHNAVIFPKTQRILRRMRMGRIVDLVKATGLDDPIRRIHQRLQTGSYPPMGDELRSRLYEHFDPHDRRLAELLGREIPWRRSGRGADRP